MASIAKLISSRIDPASFSILVGESIDLTFLLVPKKEPAAWVPIASGAFKASLLNVVWKKDGAFLSSNNPFTYTGKAPATSTIDAEAMVQFIETFEPPAKEGVISLAEKIPFAILQKKTIGIRKKGADFPINSIAMNYKKDRVIFEAVEVQGDQILNPVPVAWRLEGGEATGPLRLGILGLLGTPTYQCASLTNKIVEPTSEIEVTSFLPGEISLVAEESDRSAEVSIHIKRPITILNINSVKDSGFSAPEIEGYFSLAKEVWEREDLIEVRRRDYLDPISEPASGFSPDLTTGERLFNPSLNKLKPALKNPIAYDGFINLVDNTVWPVPRLANELLRLSRGKTRDINVYFVERVLTCRQDSFNFVIPSGFTISRDEFKILPGMVPIDDYEESGVIVAKFDNFPSFSSRVRTLDLAHELGHILLEYGEEHDPHPILGIPLKPENLMVRTPSDTVLAAWQFYLVLDYDSKKVQPFFQEVQDEKK